MDAIEEDRTLQLRFHHLTERYFFLHQFY